MLKTLRALCILIVLLILTACRAAAVPTAVPEVKVVVVTATLAPVTPTPGSPTQTPIVQVVVVVTATPMPATSTPAVTPTPAPGSVLAVVGPSTSESLPVSELKKLPVTEGYGGIKSSTGKITPPAMFKGISLLDLCDLVGGCDVNTAIQAVAKDGYACHHLLV
ncbi:MAG: hypothetical protein JXA74_13745 [Anaerolineae bacterium]|nr:hypothetical protein [Anaerolineae bacterium]